MPLTKDMFLLAFFMLILFQAFTTAVICFVVKSWAEDILKRSR